VCWGLVEVQDWRQRPLVVLILLSFCLAGCGGLGSKDDVADLLTSRDITQSAPRQPPQASRPWQADSVSSGRSKEDLFAGLEQQGTGRFTDPNNATNVAGPARTTAGRDGITLNLLNVPLALAAKNVLGDILKVNYSIADKVGGNITIQTATPLHRDALLEVFEDALKVNGAALVRAGEHDYRIVAANAASQSGAAFSNGQRRDGPGTMLHVITLRYVAPSAMSRIVEPMAAAGSVVRADDNRNLLVIVGSQRELREVANVVALFDVDWMRGTSFGFYPVESSDPDAIARELETVMGLDKEGPLKGSVRILPNRRLSSIMVISSRPGLLDTARSWIQRLDKVAESSEEQLFVYKIRNRGASELASILSRVLARDASTQSGTQIGGVGPRFDTASVSTDAGFDPARPGQSTSNRSSGIDGPGIANPISSSTSSTIGGGSLSGAGRSSQGTSSLPPNSANVANDLDTGAPGTLGQQGNTRGRKVVADEANNSLLITTTRKEFRRIEQILERIDLMPTQVMLEAMIAEVTLTDDLKFGVKWAFERQTTKHLNQAALSDITNAAVGSVFPGFSYFFKAPHLTAVIDAVSSITKVNVVSAPSLMVLDNRKATLQIGDQVPIVTQSAQNTVVVGGPVINSVTLKDTGIILNVTPRVSDSGRVVLEIDQEASNVTKTTTSGIDSPTIQQRRIHTTVVVNDGEVIALGGLIQERDGVTKSQIPILGDIPIFGAAFRQKDDKIERTELMIFIRPVVVRDSNEARGVTDEFRRRINLQPPTSLRGRDNYSRDLQRIVR
jgi:general secretion pathway protein D